MLYYNVLNTIAFAKWLNVKWNFYHLCTYAIIINSFAKVFMRNWSFRKTPEMYLNVWQSCDFLV